MTRYLRTLDFFVVGVLLILGIGFIGFGIAYDSHLYRFLKDNRMAIRLYNEEILKNINKSDSREVFAALVITTRYNNMLLKKKQTFHMFFIIGLVLCFFSIFYILSVVASGLADDIQKIYRQAREKEIAAKQEERKKQMGLM